MSAARIIRFYALADAAYGAQEIREMSERRGHVAIIDRYPRRGEMITFSPAQALRYNERSGTTAAGGRCEGVYRRLSRKDRPGAARDSAGLKRPLRVNAAGG